LVYEVYKVYLVYKVISSLVREEFFAYGKNY